MKTGFCLLTLAIILVHTNAQEEDDPVVITVEGARERMVNLGAEVIIKFEINKATTNLFSDSAMVLRKRMIGGEMVEEQMCKSLQLSGNAPPEFYKPSMDLSVAAPIIMEFKIIKVRDVDDAEYIIRYIKNADKTQTDESVNIVIIRPNTLIEMKFGDKPAFHESMSTPFSVDAGTYPVHCAAEGSNPATENIQIYFAGNPLTVSAPTKTRMEGDLTMYRSAVSAEVVLDATSSGQDFECAVVSMAGERLTIKAPVKVNVYDPPVKCHPSTAFVGQRYVELICIVDSAGYDIEKYGFEFGKSGDIIYEGQQNAKYDEVQRENIGNSQVQLTLKLYKTAASHFLEYYLVIEQKSGHVTREPVVLTEVEAGSIKGPNPNNACNMLAPSLLVVLLPLVSALRKSL